MIKSIRELIEPLIKEEGYRLVDLSYGTEEGKKALVVTIDGKGIKDCTVISRKIDPVLEENGLIEDDSLLIVSSSGD